MADTIKVLIVGATGLIGKQCLDLLSKEAQVSSVTVFTRRALSRKYPSKVKEIVLDFDEMKDFERDLKVDAVICCLGTTIAKAGSKEAFKKIDFTYPLQLATLARNAGATKFLIVTAVGANPKSSIFYNRTKGEIEEALKMLEFPVLGIYRPSLLLGDRKESRFIENMGQKLSGLLSFAIPASYKPIRADKVAASLVRGVLNLSPGIHIIESHEI